MTNKTKKYWAEIEINKNGIVRFVKANELTTLNQYKTTWKRTNARELARKVNLAELVIK